MEPNASRLGDGSARLHWRPVLRTGNRSSVHVIDALATSFECQTDIDVIASIDSAIQLELVDRSELHAAIRRKDATVLAEVDGRAQSGLETILRVVLRRLGLRVEVQAAIPGAGKVDLLVDRVVIVETDGARWHSGPRRHVDHQRDATAAAAGYTPLRFDPAQVHGELVSVVLAIVSAVRQHRGGRFSGRDAARVRIRVEKMVRT